MNEIRGQAKAISWPVMRLKFAVKLNPGSSIGWPDDLGVPVAFLPMEAISTTGEIDGSSKRTLKDVASGYTYFERGDVVIAKITPCFENGKGAWLSTLATPFGFGTTELIVLRPTLRMDGRFLYWVTQGRDFRTLGERSMTGSAGQQRVSPEFVANFQVAVPPVAVQQFVCDALESKLLDIDRFVMHKRRLIDLFEEQKRAIINRIVTRGVNGSQMKASGFGWLGNLPENWNVVRASVAFREVTETGFTDLPLLSITADRGILPQAETGRNDRSAVDKANYKRILRGDIGYNLMNAFFGGIGVCEQDGIVSPAYAVCRPKVPIIGRYFHYLFRTELYMTQFNRLSYGIMYERNRLYFERFKTLPLPLPPIAEQAAIVRAIEEQTQKIDAAIRVSKSEIDLIQEFRSALISDVVAGKLDVQQFERKVEAS